MYKTVGVFLLMSVVFALGSLTAQAQERDLIVDQAGIFGDEVAKVEEQARTLENLGADVHIWSIDSYGSFATLDDYVRHLTEQSPSWRGNRPQDEYNFKNNFFLMIVVMQERQKGIYYGSEWEQALDPQSTRIQTDLMSPKFQQGKFADGFAAGLKESSRIIDNFLHPSAPTTIVEASAPTDLSGLWKVLNWVLIFIFLGLIAYQVDKYLRARKQRLAEERQAQQSAKIAKQSAAKMRTEIVTDLTELKPIALAVASGLSADEAESIIATLTYIEYNLDTAAQYYAASETTAGSPELVGRTVAEYRAMEKNIRENVTTHLETASRLLDSLKEKCQVLQKLIMNSTATINAAREQIDRSQAIIEEIGQSGYITTEMTKENTEAFTILDTAIAKQTEKSYIKMKELCTEASQKSVQAAQAAQLIPQIEAELKATLVTLKARLDPLKGHMIISRDIFEVMRDEYAPLLWESIAGNGTEAEKRIDAAKAEIEKAEQALSLDRQAWTEAEAIIACANDYLDEAYHLLNSIIDLSKNIAQAEAEVEKEIAAAQSDVNKAWQYIDQYDGDIDESLEDDLRISEQQLAECREELGKSRPHYIKALKLAQAANSNADRVFEQSVSQYEFAERQRQQVESLLQEAERSIVTAQNYIRSHLNDVTKGTYYSLALAIEQLAQAQSSNEVAMTITLAKAADEAADSAYTMAKQAVNNAEQERERVRIAAALLIAQEKEDKEEKRRSNDNNQIDFPAPDSGGGGGSTNWGTPSGGGGGSTGW